jgi:uncharacterized protein involved in exopolysaccharide biosynthesis
LADLGSLLRRRLALLVLAPLSVAAAAYGLTALIPPVYTARTSFLPPQQPSSNLAGTLASLGNLAGLSGVGPVRNTSDQYVALMQSALVSDRLIDRFKLIEAYEAKYRVDARRELASNSRIALGRKDGLVTVEVDDRDRQRAADLANAHVEELRLLLSRLAITEAQQRRMFFEAQLEQAQERLVRAQMALQATGFTQGALRAEPRAAAEEYGRLRAEVTAAEVRLQALRASLAEGAPEFRQAQGALAALREQLARTERAGAASSATGRGGSDYISKYRDFKYQETLFDLFARQYEIARVDESREAAPIQIIDTATPPEKPSSPRRARLSALAGGATLLAVFCMLVLRARRSGIGAR